MIAVAGIGGICTLVGVVWIAVIAFQKNDILMGILSLVCGIVALVYGVQHMDEAKVPLILLVVGIVLSGVGQLAGGLLGGG
jgi:hypothetical protein